MGDSLHAPSRLEKQVEVRKRHRPRIMMRLLILLMVVCVVIGAVLFVVDRQVYQQARLYTEMGATTTAEITDLLREQVVVSTRNRQTTTYVVVYRYDVDGTTYEHQQNVSQSLFNALEVGGVVPVEYLSDSPETSRLERPESRNLRNAAIAFYGLAVVVFGIIVLLQRQGRLAMKEGSA